jgi:nucleotide-binding universal stress UspA family protein/predicted phosphoribosyltransferase
MTTSPAIALRHILHATDLSNGSVRALHHAIDLAEQFSAKLTIIHVLEPIGYAVVLPEYEAVHVAAQAQVDEMARQARVRVHDVTAVVCDGAPALEVIDAAGKLAADLVVVGTHGRSGWRQVLLGSVAAKIVRNSDVPVLTVTSWRFSDLGHAARQLLHKLPSIEGSILVGVAHGGAMLAAELSELTGAPADAFLVTPITIERGAEAGFVDERGQKHLRSWAADVSETFVEDAKLMMETERKILRARCPRLDVRGQPVVLVSERAEDDVVLQTAAAALREAGASRVTAAFAMAAPLAVERSRGSFEQTIVIAEVDGRVEREQAYRHDVDAGISVVRRRLAHTREMHRDVSAHPPRRHAV